MMLVPVNWLVKSPFLGTNRFNIAGFISHDITPYPPYPLHPTIFHKIRYTVNTYIYTYIIYIYIIYIYTHYIYTHYIYTHYIYIHTYTLYIYIYTYIIHIYIYIYIMYSYYTNTLYIYTICMLSTKQPGKRPVRDSSEF